MSFRRIRQLADPERARQQQPRFNQNGVEAERREVRDRLLPQLVGSGWMLSEPVERLWAGERDLTRLQEGCDPASAALVEMILSAHEPQHAGDRDREEQTGPVGAGHTGEWRGQQYSQWCSRPGAVEGPLCSHPVHIITREHWSCCGVERRSAPCTAPGAVTATGAGGATTGTAAAAAGSSSAGPAETSAGPSSSSSSSSSGGGSSAPRTGGIYTVDAHDPIVVQIVSFGFSESKARVAVFHGRKQGVRQDGLVEMAIDFILRNPCAGEQKRSF